MVDAVSTVVTNAQFVRSSTEQASSARSVQVDDGDITVPQAPYISPYISIDNNYNKAVLQIRDSDTGDVLRQFPSESALRARQSADIASAFSETLSKVSSSDSAPTPEIGVGGGDSPDGLGETPSVNLAQAQQASAALSAAAQTSQIAQATVSTSA